MALMASQNDVIDAFLAFCKKVTNKQRCGKAGYKTMEEEVQALAIHFG